MLEDHVGESPFNTSPVSPLGRGGWGELAPRAGFETGGWCLVSDGRRFRRERRPQGKPCLVVL